MPRSKAGTDHSENALLLSGSCNPSTRNIHVGVERLDADLWVAAYEDRMSNEKKKRKYVVC